MSLSKFQNNNNNSISLVEYLLSAVESKNRESLKDFFESKELHTYKAENTFQKYVTDRIEDRDYIPSELNIYALLNHSLEEAKEIESYYPPNIKPRISLNDPNLVFIFRTKEISYHREMIGEYSGKTRVYLVYLINDEFFVDLVENCKISIDSVLSRMRTEYTKRLYYEANMPEFFQEYMRDYLDRVNCIKSCNNNSPLISDLDNIVANYICLPKFIKEITSDYTAEQL